MRKILFIAITLVSCYDQDGCIATSDHDSRRWKREEEERWNAPCSDTSWLLATTAGSPDHATCPNKNHRMRVQVATNPSNEEAAALVFCECVRDGK
jgi:hypothetical protein